MRALARQAHKATLDILTIQHSELFGRGVVCGIVPGCIWVGPGTISFFRALSVRIAMRIFPPGSAVGCPPSQHTPRLGGCPTYTDRRATGMRTVRIKSEKFEAAFISDGDDDRDGRIVACHPSLSFMLGWPDIKARGVIKRNHWQATITRDAVVREACTLRIVEDAKPFGARYCHCGAVAHFGFRVSLLRGEEGTWFCRDHRPRAGNADASSSSMSTSGNGGAASAAVHCGQTS